jgi:hypothetical protein
MRIIKQHSNKKPEYIFLYPTQLARLKNRNTIEFSTPDQKLGWKIIELAGFRNLTQQEVVVKGRLG